MKKIVFFDLDGTLLGHEKKLPETAKEAILKLQENGVYVAIATGRGPFMFKSLQEELGIQSFVSFNGQYVMFEGEVIFKHPINKQDLEKLYQEATRNDHPLVFLNEKTMKANVDYHVFIEEGMNSLYMPYPEKDENFHINGEIYQSLLFCEKADENIYIEKLTNLNFIRWHTFSTDVLPLGGSKAKGIYKLIERLGVEIENVYAFGDGLNDIEMLKAVGTGVAMGNALPKVKKYADFITAHVDNDGIWKGLKELKLI